jgi:hypothetical protein
MIGLYAALGQLQSELGPDQRISARADLTDGIANPYWTGVWDNDGTQRTWLVSGNNTSNPFAYAADTDLADGVELASDGTYTVLAPRVEITDEGSPGAYAYWIGDEGVKAKATMASAGTATNAALLSPSAYGVEQMLGMDWYRAADPLAGRLLEDGQLELLESQWKAPDVAQGATTARFHDLTVYGYGVISDTREGGLRRDLAAGLERLSTEPAGQMFGPVEHTAATSDDPGGPLWQQLRSWANAVQPNGELPVRGATDTQAGFYPVVTTFQIYFLVTYDPDGRTSGTADDNQVFLHVMPAIVLWNPYDRTLESADYKFVAGRTYLDNQSLRDDGLLSNGVLRMSRKDSSTGQVAPFDYGFPNLFATKLIFNIKNVELAPGEVAVYSANGNGMFSEADSSSVNVLTKGYHAGGSLIAEDRQSGAGYITLPKDTTTDQVITGYSYSFETQRVIGIRMYRTDGGGDPELLSGSYYMHAFNSHTPPAANMTDYDVDIALPVGAQYPGVVDEQAVGVKYIRTFVDNDPTITPVYRTKWLANGNPRASTSGPNPILYSRNGYSTNSSVNFSYIGAIEIEGSNLTPGRGVGLSENGGIEEAVLFEVPQSPENVYSMGELMHAPLFFWNDPTGTGSTDLDVIQQRQIHSRFDNMIPAYAVGNAQADPNIALDETYVDYAAIQPQYFSFSGMHYDYSYLLNDALWDRYFFSSWENNGLPENPRMSVIDDTALTGPNYLRSAANLMIDGAFNVNSTSVEAWKALLASFYGEQVQKADGSNANNADSSPILRYREPLGSALGNGDAGDEDAYVGYKALDAGEIEDLAEAIVALVKARGPFTSLAEFINRSLEDDANTPADDRLRGLLAQALLDADTNTALEAYAATKLPAASFSATASEGWRTESIPGWLSQADLLARLGSVLSVRSDTFRIRCYGEAKDPLSDQVVGTAWCEAVVQRFPDYIDAANVAYTPLDDDEAEAEGLAPLTQENKDFGRRFKIVAFRWLTPDEL